MPRTGRVRPAFTLVELLVVIAIIGVVMALLLPAVNSAREAGRRTSCQSNQYQLAMGVIRYSDSNGFVPGWRNTLSSNFPSWAVMILPFIERMDVYSVMSGGGTPPTAYIGVFSCPSTPPDIFTANPVLAYAANVGSGTNSRAEGVMVNNTEPWTITGVTRPLRNSMEDIAAADGTAMTLVLSDKCGGTGQPATTWNNTSIPTTSGSIAWGTGGSTTPAIGIVPTTTSLTGTTFRVVNSGTTIPGTTVLGRLAQPSSNHPGGAVVAFCDGHTGFIKDSLTPQVYAQLLITNNAAVATPMTGANWRGTYTVLSEGDFQ